MYESVINLLEMSYDTRGNRYKLVHKHCINMKFLVNIVVGICCLTTWYWLAVLVDTWMGFGVTGIYIIITKPTCSTGSHYVIIVSVKFLL